MPTNMQLTIIRHGESANNKLALSTATHDEFLAKRSPDPLLTSLGEEQAEIIAQHLAGDQHPENGQAAERISDRPGYGITQLYTSAVHRALLTTRPISDALGLPAKVWPDIHEHGGMFHGNRRNGDVTSYPGMNRAEIGAAFPGFELPDEVTDDGWWTGGYEDMAACEARATRVANTLKAWGAEQMGEHIALVTHGTFIDRLLKALLDIPFETDAFFFFHYNTAITRVNFMDGGFRILRFTNRVQHLPPVLVTK